MQNRPWLDSIWQAGLHYAKQKHATEVENESAAPKHPDNSLELMCVSPYTPYPLCKQVTLTSLK